MIQNKEYNRNTWW